METLSNFIGGRWETEGVKEYDDVYNPATGEVIGRVPLSGGDVVDRAVEQAAKTFEAWRDTPVYRRSRILFRYKILLEENKERIARSVTEEHGKVLAEARAEVDRGIECVELACGATTHLQGRNLEIVATDVDVELYRQPLGVVAGICPYNFPAMIPMWMFPVAIACGNTFVLKPSERTPRTAQLLVELLQEAGLPDGVINIVHGGRQAVGRLLEHPEVRAISFVGSQPVAASIYKEAAAHGKRVQALSGAKNHMIVMPDADLDGALEAVVASAYGSSGQRCMAGSVLVAQENVADEFLEMLVGRASTLKVGSGFDPATEMGPLIREQHRRRVRGYIERGEAEGAKLLYDGRRADVPQEGFFLGPTLFDRVDPSMAIAREEIFGPVLSTVRVKTIEEAIDLVNRSDYGNGAVLFTQSGKAARQFRRYANAGMIGINVGVPAPVAAFPFSGWKKSFYGTLHVNGTDGFEFYTEKKVVTSRWF